MKQPTECLRSSGPNQVVLRFQVNEQLGDGARRHDRVRNPSSRVRQAGYVAFCDQAMLCDFIRSELINCNELACFDDDVIVIGFVQSFHKHDDASSGSINHGHLRHHTSKNDELK